MFKPYSHQLDAQTQMEKIEKEGKGGFLSDEMGMGKTVTMVIWLLMNKIPQKVDLIVVPYSLIRTWVNTIEQVYQYIGCKKPNILVYHGQDRVDLMNSDEGWDIVITTYTVLGHGELNYHTWGRVVLDESHTIKNGLKKKGPNCAKAAFIVAKNSDFRWCISGTPFNNRMKDIAAQCLFIGTEPYNDPIWWMKDDNDEQIAEWRQKFVIRRTKEGLLDPPIYHDIEIKMTPEEQFHIEEIRQNAYKDFKKWSQAQGLSKIRLQGKILALIQKLRIASNSFYCGHEDLESIDVDKLYNDNSKIKRMIDDIDKQIAKDSKHGIVVFSQFTSFFDVLEKVIEEYLIGVEVMKFTGTMNMEERNDVVEYFNKSRHPRIILVSLMAGGTGLSLHHGSSNVFLCEPYYNPFVEKQAEERVHRLGQESQVNVFRYSMENSVETWINGLKQGKLILASELELNAGFEDDIELLNFCFDDVAELFAGFVTCNKID